MFEPLRTSGHVRVLGLMVLIASVGAGFFMGGSALFFVKVLGISPVQASIGMSLSGFTGFLAAPLLGRASDRWGARRVYVLLTLGQGVLFLCYPWVNSFPLFLAVVCGVAATEFGAVPAWASLVAHCVPAEARVETRAQFRALANLGLTLGTLATSVVIAVGTVPAYYSLVVINGVGLLVCVFAARQLPHIPPLKHEPGTPRFAVLKDGPYLSLIAASSVLALHGTMLALVVPLWIVTVTSAPHYLVPVLMTVNTVLAIGLQVRVSSRARTWSSAARLARQSGVLLAAGFAVFSATNTLNGLPLIALLLVGVLLLTAAELAQSASAWGLAYDLAPPDRQGEYQGAFSLTMAVQSVLGPALGAMVVGPADNYGWLLLGGAALVAAWLVVPVAHRSAARSAQSAPPVAAVLPLGGRTSAKESA
ncbi:MFS transporter [Streptomyces sp. NPDC090029]|uniref:MFS transporter n=1 Tax=Streptomyces sp. NPDC090029 TaxID=3365924 RepID=UPI00380D5DAF